MHVLPSAAPRLETKFHPLDSVSGLAEGRIEGHASLFDVADQSGDEVAPGAFAAALQRGGPKVKFLWQHDPSQPIGVWEDLREDDRGLFAQGRILSDVRVGAEALALLRAGAIDGLSIGFRTVRAARLPDGRRRLLEIDLWEISLVTFPMLSEARIDTGAEEASELRSLAHMLEVARRVFL